MFDAHLIFLMLFLYLGVGGTSAWKLNAMTSQTTVAVYFDMAPTSSGVGQRAGYIQFLTYFQRGAQLFLRVTTISRMIVDSNTNSNPSQGFNQGYANNSPLSMIKSSFDQEVAAVVMARLAVFKCEQALQDASMSSVDVLRWIDRTLIRLCQKMADYRKDDPSSFTLTNTFSIYPQFMFHLRRSPLLMVKICNFQFCDLYSLYLGL